jgi:hypothetical protein
MKTYGFNLLQQKSRVLVKKEEKRDNYSVLVAFLPLVSVVVWLALILLNNLVIENYKQTWVRAVNDDNAIINTELATTLVTHGELVAKTNALGDVVLKDIQPEQLFVLIDTIYSISDPTFTITGYGRNQDGSFFISYNAISYARFSEVARRFSTYQHIQDVYVKDASLDEKSGLVSGRVNFNFIYEDVAQQQNAGTTQQ